MTTAVQQPDRLIVSLLNTSSKPVNEMRIIPSPVQSWQTAIVRESSKNRKDCIVAVYTPANGPVCARIPADAMVQVLFLPFGLESIRDIAICEESPTPGSLQSGLALWQTTRLRVIANLDGKDTDLSDVMIKWLSDRPDEITVEQTGLVQRQRNSSKPAVITAELPNGMSTAVKLENRSFIED